MNYALVKGGVVVNVITWDGRDWAPEEGIEVVHFDGEAAAIGYGWDGERFIPIERPKPTIPELLAMAMAETRVQRQPIVEILDGLQASALTLGQTSRAQVIETAKQGLRDITNTDLSACTTYEEMRLKVKAAYYALASALPVDLRQAFKEAIS